MDKKTWIGFGIIAERVTGRDRLTQLFQIPIVRGKLQSRSLIQQTGQIIHAHQFDLFGFRRIIRPDEKRNLILQHSLVQGLVRPAVDFFKESVTQPREVIAIEEDDNVPIDLFKIPDQPFDRFVCLMDAGQILFNSRVRSRIPLQMN